MKIAIVPYKIGSSGAKLLATALTEATGRKVFRVRSDSINFKPRNKLVVNWGCSHWGIQQPERLLNSPEAVVLAGNKLNTFLKLETNPLINLVEWTTDKEVAEDWYVNDIDLLARTKLTGHSGDGIIVVEGVMERDVPDAPLYVKYKKKKSEFRVHVFNGAVIDVQEKRRERENDEVNHKIRNRANGWVFCREDIVEPEGLREQALQAVVTLGLDFGAVDIIYNQRENQCYVLEVNCAPGIEGTTLEKYVNAIKEYANE